MRPSPNVSVGGCINRLTCQACACECLCISAVMVLSEFWCSCKLLRLLSAACPFHNSSMLGRHKADSACWSSPGSSYAVIVGKYAAGHMQYSMCLGHVLSHKAHLQGMLRVLSGRYSFDHGPIHYLAYSTELDFGAGSEQKRVSGNAF